jgi:hypothetical protein
MEAVGRSEARGIGLLIETVTFRGHPMVRATHPTTIEVTTEKDLTPRGDCIIGVSADRGCGQLGEAIKEGLREKGARVKVRLMVGGMQFIVNARGDTGLELSNPHDIVIRRSAFLSDRTLAIHADAAAWDIPREIVRALTDPRAVGKLRIEVG